MLVSIGRSTNLPSISGGDTKTDDLSRLEELEIPVSDAVSATSDHISCFLSGAHKRNKLGF